MIPLHRTTMRVTVTLGFALLLAACAGEQPVLDGIVGPDLNKKGPSGPTHILAMAGDVGPLTTAEGEDWLLKPAGKVFNNLTLRNAKVTIGQVATLSGDGEFCRTRFPNRQVDNDWDEGVRGDWVGEMVIWQDANNTSRSNIRFLGVRPEGGSTELQFTVNTHFAQQTSSGGTTTLRFIDAPLSFGAGPNRYVPRDGSGTPILYCINVTIEAAPIP